MLKVQFRAWGSCTPLKQVFFHHFRGKCFLFSWNLLGRSGPSLQETTTLPGQRLLGYTILIHPVKHQEAVEASPADEKLFFVVDVSKQLLKQTNVMKTTTPNLFLKMTVPVNTFGMEKSVQAILGGIWMYRLRDNSWNARKMPCCVRVCLQSLGASWRSRCFSIMVGPRNIDDCFLGACIFLIPFSY